MSLVQSRIGGSVIPRTRVAQGQKAVSNSRFSKFKVYSVLDIEKSASKPKGKPIKLDYSPKNDVKSLQEDIVHNVEYTVGADKLKVQDKQAYQAVAWSVRERLIEAFNTTQEYWK